MPQPRELLEEIQAKKNPSSFGESDGPMTELWCEASAMTFGKQASAASRRHIGSPVQRKRRARFDVRRCACEIEGKHPSVF